uniref:Uncharacterized protein n=1 Tax=Anopheles quadriannulatus TaxID=34691 RepID=A0A182X1R8_ANOQN
KNFPEKDATQRAVFREKDEKAKALLVTFIADSHLEYVRDKTFAKQGFACQNYVRRSLAVLKLSEGTLLMDHFRVFDQLIRQFK